MPLTPEHHPDHNAVRSQLRDAFGPGYQVALDAARVVRAIRPAPARRR